MTFLSFAIDGLHFLTAYTPDVPEKMLSCITGGVMYGLGMGLVYRVGGGTGGMDIIGGIINKYYSISQATTNFIFNIFLMICGTFFFGIESVLYTMLTFFIVFKVTNSITVGFDYKKNIIIISEHYEEIAEGIIKIVGRGVTYPAAQGAVCRCQADAGSPHPPDCTQKRPRRVHDYHRGKRRFRTRLYLRPQRQA